MNTQSGLAKRIIPCLDIKDGQTVKGVHFEDLKSAGDPVFLATHYANSGADELVFLDITATQERRSPFLDLIRAVGKVLDIPFTVGGGIADVHQVGELLQAGADKVSINSAAIYNPDLINALAQSFGSQCVVLAVDVKKDTENRWMVWSSGGRIPTNKTAIEWIKEAENRGAGEVLLTSMDHDGAKIGFAVDLCREVSMSVNIPVISSGGAGNMDHFVDVFNNGLADAALAASIFHFGEIAIPTLKQYLHEQGISVRI